jgi:hypothetical protein
MLIGVFESGIQAFTDFIIFFDFFLADIALLMVFLSVGVMGFP